MILPQNLQTQSLIAWTWASTKLDIDIQSSYSNLFDCTLKFEVKRYFTCPFIPLLELFEMAELRKEPYTLTQTSSFGRVYGSSSPRGTLTFVSPHARNSSKFLAIPEHWIFGKKSQNVPRTQY